MLEIPVDWQTITTSWGFNVAFFLGLPFTIGSIYLALKALPRSRLAYNIQSSTVISQAEGPFTKDIDIYYDGIEIPRATMSQLSVWNDGNTTIRRSDITSRKPLQISLPSGQHILQYTVASMADDAMDVQIGIDSEGAAIIGFEYLEPGQGLVCDFLHTGTGEDIKLSGVLVAAKSPVEKSLPMTPQSSGELLLSVIILCVSLPLSSMGMISSASKGGWDVGTIILSFIIGFFGVSAVVAGSVALKRIFTSMRVDFGAPAISPHQEAQLSATRADAPILIPSPEVGNADRDRGAP